jgi:hypothetical protein
MKGTRNGRPYFQRMPRRVVQLIPNRYAKPQLQKSSSRTPLLAIEMKIHAIYRLAFQARWSAVLVIFGIR